VGQLYCGWRVDVANLAGRLRADAVTEETEVVGLNAMRH
jgi:hypothetical protein